MDKLSFSEALVLIKAGQKVGNKEWGAFTYLYMHINSSGMPMIRLVYSIGVEIKEWIPTSLQLFSTEYYIVK